MKIRLTFLEGDARQFAVDRSHEEWNAARPRDAHNRFWREMLNTPWGRKHQRIPAMLDEEGNPVASMSLFDLSFVLDGRKIRAGGIASFAVRKELRKHGIGGRFMDEIHALLKDEGCDAALLFSAIDPAYYARLGYTAFPTPIFEASLDALKELPSRHAPPLVRPYEERDFPAVRELYNLQMASQRLALLRDDDYWEMDKLRTRLTEEGFAKRRHPWPFLVAERDGRVAAYLRSEFSEKDGALIMAEFGFEAGAKDDVDAMIRFLLDRLEEKPGKLRGIVPSRFENLCPSRRMAWSETKGVMMWRPVADGFAFPAFAHPDEYFMWGGDWF